MMKNSESKIVSGALIGGIAGVGAIALFLLLRKKENSLEQISKVISNVGHILESHRVEEPGPMKDFGKKIHHHESTIGAVVDWLASGINLWNKFKN